MLIFEKLSRYFKNKKMKSMFVCNVNFQKTSDFHKIQDFDPKPGKNLYKN